MDISTLDEKEEEFIITSDDDSDDDLFHDAEGDDSDCSDFPLENPSSQSDYADSSSLQCSPPDALTKSAKYFTRNLGDRSERHSRHRMTLAVKASSNNDEDDFCSYSSSKALEELEKRIDRRQDIFYFPDPCSSSNPPKRKKRKSTRPEKRLALATIQKARDSYNKRLWAEKLATGKH